MEFNVKAVDNRYARGGLNMLLAPAYGITVAAITSCLTLWNFGRVKTQSIRNHTSLIARLIPTLMLTTNIDSLTESANRSAGKTCDWPQWNESNQPKMKNHKWGLTYNDGTRATTGQRFGDEVHYSLDNQVIAKTSLEEMQMYMAAAEQS